MERLQFRGRREIMVSVLLRLFFYRAPQPQLSDMELQEYEKLLQAAIAGDGLVRYDGSYSKQRFLYYIASRKNVLLHGSNNMRIQEFEPRPQTLYNGKMVQAVFATKDAIWPVFYAVFDKSKLQGNIRNGCLVTRKGQRFHFYSISRDSARSEPWTCGMIYMLPESTFQKSSEEKVSFDEWVSNVPVKPIARLEVSPDDFYFLNKVSAHDSKESVLKTWLLLKARNWRKERL